MVESRPGPRARNLQEYLRSEQQLKLVPQREDLASGHASSSSTDSEQHSNTSEFISILKEWQIDIPESLSNTNSNPSPIIRRRKQYTREYKLATLSFYHRRTDPNCPNRLSKYRIAIIAGITEKMLRSWIAAEDTILQTKIGTRRNNSGRPAALPELEDLLYARAGETSYTLLVFCKGKEHL